MLVKRLEETLDNLYDIKGIESCILYRIDGVPISVRAQGYKEHLLEIMFWLEKQMKYVIKDMKTEGLEETTFDFKRHKIIISPASKSMFLVTIVEPEAHKQLTSIEISRATSRIRMYVS
ncbi:MAG TPA: hypothetical protein EYP22_09960 [Methanosarcinales archaeon]|nr:hypothetical protein [Methanosarcinales archaeon]